MLFLPNLEAARVCFILDPNFNFADLQSPCIGLSKNVIYIKNNCRTLEKKDFKVDEFLDRELRGFRL